MIRRCLSTLATRHADFSHAVIGAGIVGLAIGAELQQVPGNRVIIIDRNAAVGHETTLRNSEVIHAGIYYPKDSLKAKLCIEGKQKIYSQQNWRVPLRQCGKWVVAQDEGEAQYLDKLYTNCVALGVPVEFKLKREVQKYPHIHVGAAVLESPTTGIISAHDYCTFFEQQFTNNEGTLGLNATVTDIEYSQNEYLLEVHDEVEGADFTITAENVVNLGGLHAASIANMLLPPDRHFGSYFAKGNYFSYTPSQPMGKITDHLIYPCPKPNAVLLGTHLTFDLGGQIRFGPDLEWLHTTDANAIDYTPSAANLDAAVDAIRTYFPSIQKSELAPAYSGVRPKLKLQHDSRQGFVDFYIKEEEGFPGFVNLIGIESPGLTLAWAIADYVKAMYH